MTKTTYEKPDEDIKYYSVIINIEEEKRKRLYRKLNKLLEENK